MHRFRLQGKRFRYTLEVFAPVFGEEVNVWLKAMKALQHKLGLIQDCATSLELLRDDRDATAAIRKLLATRETAFRSHWRRNFPARTRQRWIALLAPGSS